MTRQTGINQLKILREHYRKEGGYLSIAKVTALDIAINSLKTETRPLKYRTCTNKSEFHEVNNFICSNCGIDLEGWSRIEYDEETGEKRIL